MDILEAIENRRSVRKFKNKDIDKEIIIKIIKAGMNAPSPKNNQPWKFAVVTGESKNRLINIMETGINEVKDSYGMLIDEKNFLLSAEATIKIMKEAPVIIFVINTENKNSKGQTPVKKFVEMANIQSIGAAVENMLLASLEYGIGGLWISDIYYVITEIADWLETDKQIVAAIALGYPDETPPKKIRKDFDELVSFI